MVLLLSKQSNTDLYEKRLKEPERKREEHTVLEDLLENNPECAKTLLSTGVGTNDKQLNEKDLVITYNLSLLVKKNSRIQVRILIMPILRFL